MYRLHGTLPELL
jgi:hypothetical protein